MAEMKLLAPRFIDVLFVNYGKTATHQDCWRRHGDFWKKKKREQNNGQESFLPTA